MTHLNDHPDQVEWHRRREARNEAAERLTLNQKLIRALHPGTDWDQYDREVRRATVERIRNGARALMFLHKTSEVVAVDALDLILDEEAAR